MKSYEEAVVNTTSTQESSHLQNKQYKTTWYAAIKEDPEALAKHKEKAKLRYEAKKDAIKQFEMIGVNIERPKKPVTYKKPSPEATYRYNTKYYNTHKEKVHQLKRNYLLRERAKDESHYLNHQREHARKYYHEVIKSTPEGMDKYRERARLYYQNKALNTEEHKIYLLNKRDYMRNRREQLRQRQTNIDSESSTRASESEHAD